MVRRKDKKGKVLEKGESHRADGIYMYRYTDLYGNRKCIYNSDLSELRKEERIIRRDIEDRIDTFKAEMTLNEQFNIYIKLKTQLANSTKNNYIDLWNGNLRENVLGNKRLCDIKKSDILRFYNSLVDRGLKYSTIKTFHHILSPCFELAVDDDVIRKNPCKGCLSEFCSKDAEIKEALTVAEQEQLLEFVRKSNVYYVYYPMLVFMLGSAVRCGEAIGLTWADVDFKNKEVKIDHQLIYKKKKGCYGFYADSPKSESGVRIIPMTSDVFRALKEQRENQLSLGRRTNVEIDGYSDFVFSTKNKNPIMPSAINNILLNIVNAYNKSEREWELPHISAHILRHTGCTRMAEAGMDPKVLQYIMGHSKIAVTMEIYNHISTDRNRKEMDKLEKIRLLG